MSVIFIFSGFFLKKLSDHIFEKHLIPFFKRTRPDLDHLFIEALSRPLGFLFLLAGISSTIAVLPLPTQPDINGFVMNFLKVILAFIFLWFLFRIVDIGIQSLTKIVSRNESKLDEQMIPFISKSVKIVITILLLLWILQLAGYNISSLLAGLGIGGLAVALALQDTLSNFFGSVAIFADKPFGIGDIVKIGDFQGTVEEIGFRSTRIRTLEATLVSIPNKTIANSMIENLSKREKVKVFQTIGIPYNTTTEQIKEVVSSIRTIIRSDANVETENIIVNFSNFGNYSLEITVTYFIKGTDYKEYLAVKERINLAIMKRLEEIGIPIAFQSTSLIENSAKKSINSLKTEKKNKKEKEGEDLPF
ncbi:MAG: mechanosensitive ion channel family protein [bacterium]|nr:mechanosensitive ion channel family protein [bacterium]